MRPTFAVVPTHDRPTELAVCVAAIAPQADYVLVIDNASDPPVGGQALHQTWPNVFVVQDPEQPPNLSRLWNVGLDWAAEIVADTEWDVAVLNDDAIPPPGWMVAVSEAMRAAGAAAGCNHPFDGEYALHGHDAMPGVHSRLTGWAFVLRGELGMRFDERFRWWAGDDDLSMRARHSGGLVHIHGYPVPNTGANTSTNGFLAEQAATDMQTFVDIHGTRPW